MEYIKLKDILTIKHGFAFKGEFFCNYDTGYLLVTPGNFSLVGGFVETKKFYADTNFPKEFILKTGDLIVTMTDLSKEADTIGYGALVPFNQNHQYLHNQRIGLVNIFNKNFIKEYIYWVMRSPHYQRTIAASSNGATVHHTSPNKIYQYSIKNIETSQQTKIASILSAYDDLIEKNNRRMEILRGSAEELYKEWFVRFRFPNHQNTKFKDSTLGKIPNDFNVVKMIDIFDNYIGGGWGNDDENLEYCVPAYVIRGTDFPYVMKGDISTCPCRWHKKSNYKSRQLQPQDIVIEISGGTAEQPVGRVILIDEDLLEQFDSKVICASFCKKISLKQDKISSIYFYYWMKFLYDTRIIDKFQLQSTGIINFKFDYFLRQGDVLLPPKLLMDKFCDIVSVIRKNISKIANQNELLKQQRDLLLPRLMSGKINLNTQKQ
ncbi:restriction endonuclease subunit S [Campylobacter sp. JMF_02 ED1]|uniref:restriction endonuclease subunit S n=1 Tax=unclassified Campylobacter TaxID=2593542 RepID=UPI0022E9DDB4|nr:MULTISPECIES: restriction endonuclease subunit S [unclassified Campylobacter]MDA3049314.1 restriction endonuclease subunit S [Campylobacter sp. JMF_15 NE4]MDA3051261.1 restriction endonuclease subunit S [Campylobacter sp. JMF_02 ED1]